MTNHPIECTAQRPLHPIRSVSIHDWNGWFFDRTSIHPTPTATRTKWSPLSALLLPRSFELELLWPSPETPLLWPEQLCPPPLPDSHRSDSTPPPPASQSQTLSPESSMFSKRLRRSTQERCVYQQICAFLRGRADPSLSNHRFQPHPPSPATLGWIPSMP